MRVRLPMRRIALFAILFLFALLLTLPLRLVLGDGGGVLTAREVSGYAWSGALREAKAGPVAVGDVSASLSPVALVTGTARLAVAREGLAGALGLSSRGVSAESVTGSFPVEGLFAPLPITTLDLTDVTVRFRDGQCDRAGGLVRATLAGELAGLPASVSGTARCDRGDLLLPLGGVVLRVSGDGRYEARGGPLPAIRGRL